jgi:hypothetical protein
VIKLKSLLREADSVLNAPKGTYVQVKDAKERKRLSQNLYDLIQNAYKDIGGHHDFKTPDGVLDPELTFWSAADIDDDPDVDVVSFGKSTPHGIKHTGMGHDGDKANIKNLLTKKTANLKQPGNYAEVSGDAFRVYFERGNVPVIEDEALVRKVLGTKYDIEWHGKHPTDASKKGNGWYSRMSGGNKRFTKTLIGIPTK